ncbi:polysaccharide deacetylase family protein [Pelagibius sp.]|uniref:polysaccharide deacetylase family protein n=1 Tax=Pelagibius sp. TaxID=1931238 RepID=UPI003BB13A69
MKLPTHGRYGYSAITERAVYDWPNGTRLAVYIGLNLEHFAFGEGLGAKLAPAGPEPDVLNFAWRDYGNRVGVWRMLDMFDTLGLPAGVLVNAAIYDHCPQVVAAFRERGDEIIAHGRSNSERQGDFDEADERNLIAEVTAALAVAEGKAPAGWLGPWISESRTTPDLLQEAGYRYLLDWCCDDQPIWLETRSGRILALPYPQEVNDIPAIPLHRMSPADFTDLIVDNFEEMLQQAEAQPLVMGIALHPYLVGQPYRLRHLRRALQHIAAEREQVWLTTPGAIADHVIENDLAV